MIGKKLGHYEVLTQIGREVYQARTRSSGETWRSKCCRKSLRKKSSQTMGRKLQ